MANKTMHHAVIGADTFELIDEAGREETSQLKNALITDSASGSIASFPDGGDGFAVRDLKVQLEPIQAGSGDPSPDNVRPISGRDSVTVTRTGKNLADTTPQMTDSGLYIQLFGESQTAPDKSINVKSGQTYTLSISFAPTITGNWGVYGKYVGNSTIVTFMSNSTGSSRTAQWTATKDGDIFFWLYSVGSEFTDAIASAIKVQLELGSTATAYEPYNGQSIEIQLGQTVYGGTLDVTQGVLSVDRAVLELNTLTWIAISNNRWSSSDTLSNAKPPSSNSTPANAVCSMYKNYSNDHLIGADIGICIPVDKYIRVKNGSTTETPTGTFVYEIAQPVTVQLTPQQMTTLLGQNNVWSDADSVSVDYVADTKLYIEQLTEPDADMVADMNITSGKYFMVGNTLYLATANIANGANIIVGVNCTRTSLAEALNAINA